MTTRTFDTTFFVQVKKLDRAKWSSGKMSYTSAVKMTQTKPSKLEPGCVAIKLTVRMPESAFEPFSPSAVVDVPDSLTTNPAHVIVEDPS